MYELNGKPDYKGSRDEIIRADIEDKFTRMITLKECCGETPTVYFQSYHDWFVRCPKCRKQTEMCKHQYEAMQEWNRQEFKKEGIICK